MAKTKLVNSISRSVDIMEIIAKGANRLQDICQVVGLNKSTTHRLLKSLTFSGLIFQNPINRQYYLGHMFLKLVSNPLVSHKMLTICAIDQLRRLRDLSGESAMIIIPNGTHRLVTKGISSNEKIAFFAADGDIEPIHVGSSGKLLLSQFKEKEYEKILRTLELKSFGPNTITDKDLLRQEVARIRIQKYAISSGEAYKGAVGISVPVENYVCPVALCLQGPEFRFNPIDFLEELRKSSDAISKNLK